MKKTVLILLVVLTVVCKESFGQEKFVPAYIITNENDTIQGQILNKIDSKLAFEVLFKDKASNAGAKSYTVSDLAGFGFSNGRTFEKFKFDTSSVFAKKVLTGKIDLWIWRHSKEEPDFFLKNKGNKEIVHLSKVDDKLISNNGKEYVKHDHRFIGQIKQITDNDFNPLRKKDLKYSENNIIEQLSAINKKYEEQIPFNKYKEKLQFRHDIFVGIPINPDPNSTEFKLGFFRRKIKVEKNTNFSTIRGITYFGWHSHDRWDGRFNNGTMNHRWQLINIIPLGVHFQGRHKYVKPYTYGGFGLAILALSDYQIEDYQNKGSKTSIFPYPTVYAAAGLQVKIRSNYLFIEFTPSLWNSTIKLGFGF